MIEIKKGDTLELVKTLEDASIDLLWTDPPYNINFAEWDKLGDAQQYSQWLNSWLKILKNKLKSNSSGYICIDWRYSYLLHSLLIDLGFIIRNRITWKRDKGRGSKNNWKNMHEDIFFFTLSNNYTFNINDVMVKKSVLAPYRDEEGNPKDWFEDENGDKWRYTYPGNLWEDFTVPYWSMREVKSYAKTKKTPLNIYKKHPTQKPLDLVKRCITASSKENDLVLDLFNGSGTTAVACKQLKRNYIGFELNEEYINITNLRLNVE